MAIAMYFGKPIVADAPAQLSDEEYKAEWIKLMSSRPFSFPEGIAGGVAHWLVTNGLETYDDFRCNFAADTDYAEAIIKRCRQVPDGEISTDEVGSPP